MAERVSDILKDLSAEAVPEACLADPPRIIAHLKYPAPHDFRHKMLLVIETAASSSATGSCILRLIVVCDASILALLCKC